MQQTPVPRNIQPQPQNEPPVIGKKPVDSSKQSSVLQNNQPELPKKLSFPHIDDEFLKKQPVYDKEPRGSQKAT